MKEGVYTLQYRGLALFAMANPVMFRLVVGGTWVANKGCDWAVEKADIYAPNTEENLANFIQGVDPDISREDAERFAKDLTETAEQALRFGASAAITAAVATGTVPAGKNFPNKQGTGEKVGKKGTSAVKGASVSKANTLGNKTKKNRKRS